LILCAVLTPYEVQTPSYRLTKFLSFFAVVLRVWYVRVCRYRFDTWKGSTIPLFREGQRYPADVWALRQGTTCAPSRLTQAELITLMDKEGIGTDATMATHITTIQVLFPLVLAF